ncbi:MAG: hypothetical protein HY866_13465 [Chloroflexi bacterium]|nr:hypothetical protein [Chloroflexota bacterium]
MERKDPAALVPDKERVQNFFAQNTIGKPSKAYSKYSTLAIHAVREAQRLRQQTLGSAQQALDALEVDDNLPGRLYLEAESVFLHLGELGSYLYSAAFAGFEASDSVKDEYCSYLNQLVEIYNRSVDYSNNPGLNAATQSDLQSFLDKLNKFLLHAQSIFSRRKSRFSGLSQKPDSGVASGDEMDIPFPTANFVVLGALGILVFSAITTLSRLISKPSFLDFSGFIFLALVVQMWYSTIRVYRRFPDEIIGQMFRVTLKTQQRFMFLLGLLSVIIGSIDTFIPGVLSPLPALLELTLGFLAISNTCLPPSLLMLGASKTEAASLYFDIVLAIFPLKVVHLIDDFRFGAIYEGLGYSNYRTLEDNEWKNVVREFMEIVPAIVIDTRIENDAVLEEAEWIFASPELLKKSLFVTNPDGTGPVLSEVQTKRGAKLSTIQRVTPERIRPAIRQIKNNLFLNGF